MLRLRNVCGFCAKGYFALRNACPGCGYPADGDFSRAAPRPEVVARCPQCGAVFRAGRKACPECGSDERTGWKRSEDVEYESVDLPEARDEEDQREALLAERPWDARLLGARRTRLLVVGLLLVASMVVPALVLLWLHLR